MNLTAKDRSRFWEKVQVADPDECWEWTANKFSNGYGSFFLQGKVVGAHRASVEISGRELPKGLNVCHTCDNRSCVNPAHLFLGTQKDNIQDAVQKGRMAKGLKNGSYTRPDRRARGDRHGSRIHPESLPRGDRHYSRLHPEKLSRGEKHSNSKLTESQVLGIRSEKGSQRGVAKKYGVSYTTVRRIIRRETWSHV